ncbi:hypothetical protein TYRP_020739 [Tyrophagus putrescentiae]|nr:hypothetical protein TYRP_020739 [Tyrophagus putrescentiae]
MSGPAAHPDVTWPLSTPSSSGPARCAHETLVSRPRRPELCNNCAPLSRGPPTAQDESGGSDSSENGSESAQLYPELQLLR